MNTQKLNNKHANKNHAENDDVLVAELQRFVDERAAEYDAIAQDIWEHPEVAFQEKRSSALYRERLASRGFAVKELPELENSFVAEKVIQGWNSAAAAAGTFPVIGFMGEYDALPGMSQACSAERRPREAGAPGHACGHNLLGAGSLVAVEALVHLLERRGVAARVRYYGCPAEESLGRIPMVKAGRFGDASAVLTWHPADVNTPHRYVTSANLAAVFSFKGRASHAGMAPYAGRSALDAAQLFNLSMEFMREHLEPGVMLHYVISDGGQRPNIVPESSATFLYIRAPSAAMVRSVMARLTKAARGACLMTETSFKAEIKHGKCDYRPNETIQDTLLEAMRALPLPQPSPEEKDFAKKLQATVDKKDRPATLLPIGAPASLLKAPIHAEVGDFGAGKRIGGSLDTGDVSYVVPVGQMNAATWPLGVGAHTWQSCAASGSPWAFKAMRWAGMSMALAAFRLAAEPELLAAAQAEFKANSLPYRSTMDV
ncbi:MAG: amidohydrolase [Spirochaetia bacterium]|jgi:aminobenzoyl-glutamate utilization protein B|nr:amidohydrolase [Spirochaetia bacterium]